MSELKYTQKKYLDKKHGDLVNCPTCGMSGWLDIDTPEGKEVAWPGQSVWFNHYTGWECSDCYDK